MDSGEPLGEEEVLEAEDFFWICLARCAIDAAENAAAFSVACRLNPWFSIDVSESDESDESE